MKDDAVLDGVELDGAALDMGLADQQRITEALGAIIERRAVIEQAKGMLMLVYGVAADEAFDVLRRQSQDHNVKLVLLAEQVVTDLVELSQTKEPRLQLALGGLMDEAKQRVSLSAR